MSGGQAFCFFRRTSDWWSASGRALRIWSTNHICSNAASLTPNIHEPHSPARLAVPPIVPDDYPKDSGSGRRLWELQFEVHQVLNRNLGIRESTDPSRKSDGRAHQHGLSPHLPPYQLRLLQLAFPRPSPACWSRIRKYQDHIFLHCRHCLKWWNYWKFERLLLHIEVPRRYSQKHTRSAKRTGWVQLWGVNRTSQWLRWWRNRSLGFFQQPWSNMKSVFK